MKACLKRVPLICTYSHRDRRYRDTSWKFCILIWHLLPLSLRPLTSHITQFTLQSFFPQIIKILLATAHRLSGASRLKARIRHFAQHHSHISHIITKELAGQLLLLIPKNLSPTLLSIPSHLHQQPQVTAANMPSSPSPSSSGPSFMQMQTSAAHRQPVSSHGRPQTQPVQGFSPPSLKKDSSISSQSSTSSISSASSSSRGSPLTSPTPVSSMDFARCSRCKRSVSLEEDAPAGSSGVSFAINSFYCKRCAEMVGYYR